MFDGNPYPLGELEARRASLGRSAVRVRGGVSLKVRGSAGAVVTDRNGHVMTFPNPDLAYDWLRKNGQDPQNYEVI